MKDKITILSLSGWAQKPDSLQSIFKNIGTDFEIINFDYNKFDNVEDFFSAIKNLPKKPQIITGWSLGGQLGVRLIAEKILNPELLILIGAPFQFVKSPQIIPSPISLALRERTKIKDFRDTKPHLKIGFGITAAMPKIAFDKFRHGFDIAPDNVLKKFSILTMMNDTNSYLCDGNWYNNNHKQLIFWLDELGKFSCYDINFKEFPETLIIHGAGDVVVHCGQAKIFAEKIVNSELEVINNCGHAPHFNHLEKLQLMISKKINSIYK